MSDTREIAEQIAKRFIHNYQWTELADAIDEGLRNERERCAQAVCQFCANPRRYGPALQQVEGSLRWWHRDLNNDCGGFESCAAAAIRNDKGVEDDK